MEWVNHYGKERIYVTTLGHTVGKRAQSQTQISRELVHQSNAHISRVIETLLGISHWTARNLLAARVANKFVEVADPAKKARKYGLISDLGSVLQ